MTAISGEMAVRNNVAHTELINPQKDTEESAQSSTAAVPLIVVDKVQDQESALLSDGEASPEVNAKTTSNPSDIKDQDTGSEDNPGELEKGPLLSHESGSCSDKSADELSNGPLLSHENGVSTQEDDDELEHGPPSRHECGSLTSRKDSSEVLGELGNAPLMSHETGLSYESSDRSESTSELGKVPLMSLESASSEIETSSGISKRDFATFVSRETSSSTNETTKSKSRSESLGCPDDDLGELGKAPPMSHEIGFSKSTYPPSTSFTFASASRLLTLSSLCPSRVPLALPLSYANVVLRVQVRTSAMG